MNVEQIVLGHITKENIGEIVKQAKSTFTESSHETTKGEGRAVLYNFFKEKFEEIKETLTICDEKGVTKPKYAVLKKFLIGEGIFKGADHYNRAMVSINHHNRSIAKLEKLKAEQVVKAEFQARIDACEGDAEKEGELLKEQYIIDKGIEAEGSIAKRENERQSVLKNVKSLSNIDNLRKLHRDDNGAILELARVIGQYAKENAKSQTEIETESETENDKAAQTETETV